MTTENEVTAQTCAVCATDIDADDVVMTVNDDVVCNDCLRSCERCGDVYSQDDDMSIVNGNDIWCADCVSQRAYYCDHCEEYNSYGNVRLQDRRQDWCEDCLNSTYWCEECDGYYVDGCDESHDEPDSRIVHDYNYRPDPIFHGEKGERLYFGIEIEVEAGNNLNDASNYAFQLEELGLAYLKSDGSLNCGFEVVSHPISHNHWKNAVPDFFKVMEGLRSDDDYKVKSWDTKTCGIHIHVSRAGFGEANGYGAGPHMHRFLNLIYSNQELYEALAGRSSSRWASFHDIDSQEYITYPDGSCNGEIKTTRHIRGKITHGYRSERYSAVNTKNAHTLEIRIFRGSVNGNVIKAHLDLAHASVEYTRVMSVSEVRDGALSPDNFIAYIRDNATLYPELVARLAKVWNLTSSASRQEVSI